MPDDPDVGQRDGSDFLRASQQQLVDILDKVNFFVGLFSPEGIVLEANRAPLDAAAIDRAEVIGKPFAETYWWSHSPAVQEELRRALERAAAGETVRYDEQVRVAEGRLITIDVTFSPLRDGDGRVTQIVGSAVDITERKRVEEALRQSLAEKSLLLREVHHRVKNNLQLVSSLLYFQERAAPTEDVRRLFYESRGRVKAMATIHEALYESSDLSRIDFSKYVVNVTSALMSGYERDREEVHLALDVHPVFLDIQVAVPCGLILNELVTNALKYAFPAGRRGVIRVAFSRDVDGHDRLVVSDDGVGLPLGVDPRASSTLGLRLVHTLAEQIGATMNVSRGAGTRFDIEFHGG